MRRGLDRELEHLKYSMTDLGAECERLLSLAIQLLLQRGSTPEMDWKEEASSLVRDVEAQCLSLLLRRQPVARDLREVSAALKIASDLQRIADQALDVANIANREGPFELPEALMTMAQDTKGMVRDAIDAFVHLDGERAFGVIDADDAVDAAYQKVKSSLAGQDDLAVEAALNLLLIAKYFERIADHGVNIARHVLSVLGEEGTSS